MAMVVTMKQDLGAEAVRSVEMRVLNTTLAVETREEQLRMSKEAFGR